MGNASGKRCPKCLVELDEVWAKLVDTPGSAGSGLIGAIGGKGIGAMLRYRCPKCGRETIGSECFT